MPHSNKNEIPDLVRHSEKRTLLIAKNYKGTDFYTDYVKEYMHANKNGTSPRANTQVNKLNKAAGTEKYYSRIVQKDIPGRQKGLEAEKSKVQEYKDKKGVPPVGNIRPKTK